MTGRRVTSGLARLLTVVTLVMSGMYLIIYLYRWEWNRAIISGVFFLGAEIALAASLILGRLQARVPAAAADPPPAPGPAPAAVQEPAGNVGEESPFAWLGTVNQGFGVFVPVLLGAGVLLSTIAFLVERLARLTMPGAGHRRTGGSAALRLPAGGLLAPRAPAPAVGTRRDRAAPLRVGLALAALGVVTALGVQMVADATQSRPDPRRAGTTSILLEISTRDGSPRTERAIALWVTCREVLPDWVPTSAVVAGPNQVAITAQTALGRSAHLRLTGCLEDGTLSGVRGRVLRFEAVPENRPAAFTPG